MNTLTCINCPIGCQITVVSNAQGIQSVSGNLCKRGIAYAQTELTNPTRTVTSTVRLRNALVQQLPVKTSAPISKAKIRECMRALKAVEVTAPVRTGETILHNVCGTGIDIVSTRSVPAKV